MHILWIKTELLHPVDKGGRIRTYHMLRALRREHRVTYVALDDGTSDAAAVEAAQEYCHELIRVPFQLAERRSVRFFAEIAQSLVSRLPYATARYRSPELRDAIARAVRERAVDVVVCDFLAPSVNVPDDLGVPVVLFQHNVETMIWQRHAEVAANPLARLFMRDQWRRMRAFETSECRRFDHVVAVSPQDAAVFRDEFGVASVSDVPTGVDTEYFRPTGAIAPRPAHLVFTGSMDWLPNEDAIRWFVEEILPRVRARRPDVTLSVVGRRPTAAIRALADAHPGVEVTGAVPDVRPFVEAAALFIVPIRVGGGTRLKIFEAMAMAKPVVSTTIGAEGLPTEHGTTAWIADDAETFAAGIVGLLADPATATRIGDAGAALVRTYFGWDGVAARFAATCAAVAGQATGHAPAASPIDGAPSAAPLAARA